MSEDTKQSVVDETQAGATPPATVDSARNDGDDLESLLAQFSEQTAPKSDPVSPQPQTQQQPQTPQPDPLVVRLYNRYEREDINNLVKQVKGDFAEDDEMVEAWIDAEARKDVRLQRAWMERDANPQAFQRIAKELGREFAKRASKKPDANLTEDREVVAAAVRGASTNKAPPSPPPNYTQMSHNEYRNKVREQYGFDPG
jgi:hypothetical protein